MLVLTAYMHFSIVLLAHGVMPPQQFIVLSFSELLIRKGRIMHKRWKTYRKRRSNSTDMK